MPGKIKITAHSLVKNEKRWIWYSLMSVIDYVDEILVWDTGSTDQTVKIIKSIASPKIKFRQVHLITPDDHTRFRQQMLDNTRSDWLLMLDGDEIWPDQAIQESLEAINKYNRDTEFFIRPYYNLVGDVYHYQESIAGQYNLFTHVGFYTIRTINLRLLPGLHFGRPHGQQGVFDGQNVLIQDRRPGRYRLLSTPFLHATHLRRSATAAADNRVIKRQQKYKYELGLTFSRDFSYPKVFYFPHPDFVPSPWDNRSLSYVLNAAWQSPLRWLKRRLPLPAASGY